MVLKYVGHNMNPPTMSSQPSAFELSASRPMINYCPGVHTDYFINCNIPDGDDQITFAYRQQQIRDLKDKVGRELMAAAGKPSQQLNFIDALQRLGLAYHFEKEIEEALGLIHDYNYHHSDDLRHVSLRFRLLRQQGYHVSCDVFKTFRDGNSSFKKSLINDVEGILGLYEAAHLRVHGEDILDEALSFTTTHLKASVEHLDYHLAAKVNRALYRPIRRCLERLEARPYISIYQDEASHSKALLELAKLDFNQLQSLFKKELSHITRWWTDLDFPSKLPFCRDRMVESYFWIAIACFEPQYTYARRIQAKLHILITLIDDMYDAYGTPGELELFTEAIERWDYNGIDKLPEYMKPCYRAFLDAYKEIEEMESEERSYCVRYTKEAMQSNVRTNHDVIKWFHRGYMPTVEEYLSVAPETSVVKLFTVLSFVGMGSMATKKKFDWVLNDSKIMNATSTILRLMNDMASRKFEQERGHGASVVECYMNQHGVSKEEAYQELNKQVENAWKDVNQECLQPTAIPSHLLSRLLNFARAADFMYAGGKDIFTNVEGVMNDTVASLFIHPIPI